MTAMAVPRMTSAPAASVAAQRWFVPPLINATMPAPVQLACAATRLRPMEQPAMTAMPAPQMMSALTAPAAGQRSFARPSINATMRAPVQQAYAVTRLRQMEVAAMTAMPAPPVMSAPTARAAVQRSFAPPSISAMMPARVQRAHAATRLRPMEQPAMTGMPAPPVMFAPTAPAADQRWFAPPSISAMMPARVQRAYAATRLRQMEQPAMTAMPAPQVMSAPTAPAAARQ